MAFWIAGLDVIVGRYKTEDEAYAVESTLIQFMFGHENLTNVVIGHSGEYIKTMNEFQYPASFHAIARRGRFQESLATPGSGWRIKIVPT